MKKIKNRFAALSNRQKIFLVIVVVILALVFFNNSRNSVQQPSYNLDTVKVGTVKKTITTSGLVQAQKSRTYIFTNSTSAKVTEILVTPGQNVETGQVLARMDNSDLNTRVTQAQSALNQARNNYDNTKLMGGRNISYLDLRNLEERIRVAEADLALAQRNLAGAELKAEFSGQVLAITANIGDLASTMQITVIEPKNYYLEATLAESDVINVKLEMPVTLDLDAFSDKEFTGKVSEITLAPTITANISAYPIKINLEDPENVLRVGLSADAEIIIEQKENVLTVPTSAIVTRNGQNFINKLVNGRLQPSPIEIGLIGDTQTEVVSGLSENEEIVVSMLQNTTPSQGFGFGGGGNANNPNSGTSQSGANSGRNPFRN